MRRITTLLGLMLLLWLGALPVAAFTRAESKAASMVTSLQAGHDFPLAAQLSDEALWAKSNELLAAIAVWQPKTALREGGPENQAFTWEMKLVIHFKHKGYPARIIRIALGPVVFSDHLGTPYAYHNPVTDTTSFTPFNPWGELLARTASNNPPWEGLGQVPTTGFTLAADSVFALPPLGLAGHIYDREVGLVQMHHRSYSPRLGQFATPDYRAPNLYDPSTFTEPYAYAAGNPMLYWDPDGLSHFPAGVIRQILDEGGNLEGREFIEFVIGRLAAYNQNEGVEGYPVYSSFGLSYIQTVPVLEFIQNEHETELNTRLLEEGIATVLEDLNNGGPTRTSEFELFRLLNLLATFEEALPHTYQPRGEFYFGSAYHRAIRFNGDHYQLYHYLENQDQAAATALLGYVGPLALPAMGSMAQRLGQVRIPYPTIQTTELNTVTAMAGLAGKFKVRSLKLKSLTVGELLAINSGTRLIRGNNPSRLVFGGMEVRAVRNLSHIDESTLRAMAKKGFAAKDINGDPLILHHLKQNPAGPLVEIPAFRHSIGNRVQHPFGNASGLGLTAEQRSAFNLWRESYWKARALEELTRRGLSP